MNKPSTDQEYMPSSVEPKRSKAFHIQVQGPLILQTPDVTVVYGNTL
jgi:hypothetical protein